jgi:hypothetical protein
VAAQLAAYQEGLSSVSKYTINSEEPKRRVLSQKYNLNLNLIPFKYTLINQRLDYHRLFLFQNSTAYIRTPISNHYL